MADDWFYAHDIDKLGPFTARQLKDLAATGEILTTDTIWREGVGTLATKIKNLFPPPASESAVSASEVPESALPTPVDLQHATSESVSAETAALPVPLPAPAVKPRKKRAVAVQGVIITSQDGTSAHYRKKCVKCQHEDSSQASIQIRVGLMRSSFFCTECKKIRPVVIQGSM